MWLCKDHEARFRKGVKPIKIAQQCPACRRHVQAQVVQEESTDEFLVVACPQCDHTWEVEIDFHGVDRTLVRGNTGPARRERPAGEDNRRQETRRFNKKGRR